MTWTGLGCLLQCINSIVWNKNAINRAPVYCDICMSFNALSLFHSLYVSVVTSQPPVFKLLGTIPVGTYFIVSNVKIGVIPWRGWAAMHSYNSSVAQVAGFIWGNDPVASRSLELFRWSLVECAFIFFAFFGFAGEAREHYYRLYKSLAGRIGKSTSTPHRAPHACVVLLICLYPLSIWAYVNLFFFFPVLP